ncbi:PREDICTED: CD82 antigen isoform X2 [Odobenus rosmarus divergens]|uniref:Tetraspanin n=1 Tax=Odobenus rosmarus divergens TaxID=9708 RepID=A0A2U3VWA6_ODORO|nr:PREDICTED: CD82 antigen isoform X2 [Odobenus rosmarus divergens]
MGSACIKVTKYFLFLFNLLFFILGAVILGFGVWILADKSSFISVLQTSSSSLKVGACVFVGVGAVTMFMGFLGCIGAIKEVRCLLGLLKQEMGNIVTELIQNYKDGHEDRLQEAWDYVQAQVKCCGWVSFYNWTDNAELRHRTNITYPCSCEDRKEADEGFPVRRGFCEASDGNSTDSGNDPASWPVYREVRGRLWGRAGPGALRVRLLGMLLSICLCRHVHSEDYSKVPKY